ncbi:MMPL family transporter [Corynebacterium lactis]|uniref:Multidrug RND transporter n=1 Tax=Corynebacterium lactis RW2-5 TaxID=1408189 RepID=A0A0K2GXH8_9CORY|nr:MMPL family transporter [Corynebacterium lactis]ALA66490.1 multidrug RND transporter [Corynebacterium lactis RW2-5]
MAKVLFKLGRFSYLHKWTVIIAWLLILAGLGGSVAAFQKGFIDQFSIPGMPSANASHVIEDKFPDVPNPIREQRVYVVFEAPEGQLLSDPLNKAAASLVIDGIKNNIDQIADDLQLVNPVDLDGQMREVVKSRGMEAGLPKDVAEADAEALRTISDDGRFGISTFVFDAKMPQDIRPENMQALLDAMQAGRDAGLKVEASGPGMQPAIEVAPTSEIIGVSVAFVVLVVTFGSVVASFLPIITAIVGIIIGVLGVVLMTAFTDVNSITPVLAVMFGLAVGIDYALFILSRYRAELSRGMTKPDAVGMATGTAGSAVVFAGLTVIVALAALTVAKVPFMSLMGISAAITVGFTVLVSLTLLPAIMSLLGDKVFAVRIPGIAGNPTKKGRTSLLGEKTLGRRWVTLIHKVPGLFLAGCIVLLCALAYPAMNLNLALPSDSTQPKESTNRKAIAMIEEGFGAGRNSQLIIIADSDNVNPDAPVLKPLIDTLRHSSPEMSEVDAARKASYSYAVDQFKSNVGVEHIQMIGLNKDGTSVKMIMTPKSGPLDPATKQLMNAVRDQQKQIERDTGLYTGVTGLVPIEIDITDRLSGAMPLYLGVVVGLAVILLLMIFRSIMVPLTAGMGFLLSVGAAFGVTVMIFQNGLWGIIGTPGPLVSFVPIFLIGVTFGLAMDYQVFLVSRMREHFTHSKGKATPGSRYSAVEESVIEGFSLGARVVTAAAIIMISVFAAFAGQPLQTVKVFGFALGAAVLFDAFVIRMTFIPASMFLLGRATWWMPRWLDKILPSVDVEGAALEEVSDELVEKGRRERAAAAAEATTGAAENKAKESTNTTETTEPPELPQAEQLPKDSEATETVATAVSEKASDRGDSETPAPTSKPAVATAEAQENAQRAQQRREIQIRPDNRPVRRKKLTVADLARREGTDLEPPRHRRAIWDPSANETPRKGDGSGTAE